MKDKEEVVTKIGVVDGYEIVCNGRQWTLISGVKYATTWEVKKRKWGLGDEVVFDVTKAMLRHGNPEVSEVLQATNIRLAQPASPALSHPEQASEPEKPCIATPDPNPSALLGW